MNILSSWNGFNGNFLIYSMGLISSPDTEVEINSCKYKLILKSIIIL